ncbi:MAG: enoyl-CoA hydratase-related protein, partial [Actinomycetota bacterium]|nr:enoyl-CoA hydratase-related protein [Actinomycetota bacterium]
GLFNRLVPTDQVLPQALEIAHTVASNAPLAVQAARRVIRQSVDLDEDDALLLESDSGAVLAESDDAKEGPLAFMEKRTPKFQGR